MSEGAQRPSFMSDHEKLKHAGYPAKPDKQWGRV